jgi:hypothetical protein
LKSGRAGRYLKPNGVYLLVGGSTGNSGAEAHNPRRPDGFLHLAKMPQRFILALFLHKTGNHLLDQGKPFS